MENFIVAGILLLLVALAIRYIYKEKKKGTPCIGCPSGGCCKKEGEGCHGECSCNNIQ